MRRRSESARQAGNCRCCDIMRDELCHALVEALYELDVLPGNEEGAIVGIYAVMDDLRTAMDRAECMDLPHSA